MPNTIAFPPNEKDLVSGNEQRTPAAAQLEIGNVWTAADGVFYSRVAYRDANSPFELGRDQNHAIRRHF